MSIGGKRCAVLVALTASGVVFSACGSDRSADRPSKGTPSGKVAVSSSRADQAAVPGVVVTRKHGSAARRTVVLHAAARPERGPVRLRWRQLCTTNRDLRRYSICDGALAPAVAWSGAGDRAEPGADARLRVPRVSKPAVLRFELVGSETGSKPRTAASVQVVPESGRDFAPSQALESSSTDRPGASDAASRIRAAMSGASEGQTDAPLDELAKAFQIDTGLPLVDVDISNGQITGSVNVFGRSYPVRGGITERKGYVVIKVGELAIPGVDAAVGSFKNMHLVYSTTRGDLFLDELGSVYIDGSNRLTVAAEYLLPEAVRNLTHGKVQGGLFVGQLAVYPVVRLSGEVFPDVMRKVPLYSSESGTTLELGDIAFTLAYEPSGGSFALGIQSDVNMHIPSLTYEEPGTDIKVSLDGAYDLTRQMVSLAGVARHSFDDIFGATGLSLKEPAIAVEAGVTGLPTVGLVGNVGLPDWLTKSKLLLTPGAAVTLGVRLSGPTPTCWIFDMANRKPGKTVLDIGGVGAITAKTARLIVATGTTCEISKVYRYRRGFSAAFDGSVLGARLAADVQVSLLPNRPFVKGSAEIGNFTIPNLRRRKLVHTRVEFDANPVIGKLVVDFKGTYGSKTYEYSRDWRLVKIP